MDELLINENDALATYGVRMGKGFIDALLAFPPMKENIESKSRLNNGKKVIIDKQRNDSRDLTLSFTIQGDGTTLPEVQTSLVTRKAAFRTELEKGKVCIKVPALGSEIYRLVYTGKSVTHSMSLNRVICTLTCKFEEPDPSNRGSEDNGTIKVIEHTTE